MRLDSTTLERFEEKYTPEPNTGCWLWTAALDAYGYAVLGLIIDKKKRPKHASRISYQLFRGDVPLGTVVRHICDEPLCVNPDHLILGTQEDNMADKVRRNRQNRGDNHGRRKLTLDQVMQIKSLRLSGLTLNAISEQFDVGEVQVWRICNGKRWKHLTETSDAS